MPRRKRKKVGTPPGSLIFVGEQRVANPDISLITYTADAVKEIQITGDELHVATNDALLWYDVRGLHDTSLIGKLGDLFHIHPLAQEDILNPHQRPKLDEYDDGFIIFLKALKFNPTSLTIETEQVAIFCTNKAVLTFQEDTDDLFVAIRERLHNGMGKMRKRGTDYLSYALLDSIVDNYFLVLDSFEEKIENLEVQIAERKLVQGKATIHHLKREISQLRKIVLPLREGISKFAKEGNDYIDDINVPFWRDLYDHIVQVIDISDDHRDTIMDLHNLYLSEISYRLNNVIQVLTIISTIFIPLTFIAGIYGMNFDNMPELRHPYGYYYCLLGMFLVFAGMMVYFKRKGWLN
ncbi:MAG: magnesium/cobalt transporter CorA [Saprospiraceae bacterium]|nr:magnesium/cobalt transporter CorA [Saprospiraceae bacterium]MBP7680187.1 magnesium/cobalt transporter CorA [Saprospiraceae bacterium]